jgi:uncharacterized protein YfaT (DUF1175 family)
LANDNPVLDSRIYEVKFPNGNRALLVANVIEENLFAQVDPEGNRLALPDDIVDYFCTNSKDITSMDDGFIVMPTGTKRKKESTVGWELLLQWKDSSTTWVPVKGAEEAYPV